MILLYHTEDKLILEPFPCSQREVGTGEHRPITEKRILRMVQSAFSKLVSISKKRRKVNNCVRKKYGLKCLDLQIKYPRRETVPLNAIFTEKMELKIEREKVCG